MSLLVCAANFSEGRDHTAITRIVRATRMPGIRVLDLHTDVDHNRSVLTFAGQPAPATAAAEALAREAVKAIDLRHHEGVHPTMGAVDVIPFNTEPDLASAVDAAREVAKSIGDKLEVPVFLFGEASIEDEIDLPSLRSSTFESRYPDFGPRSPHSTAGATCVGARSAVVAFNVNLASDDLALAHRVAKAIRATSGGLTGVRALGFPLRTRGIAQISTTITNPSEVTISDVFAAVVEVIGDRSKIAESELVGLIPSGALGQETESLGLISPAKILEEELRKGEGRIPD